MKTQPTYKQIKKHVEKNLGEAMHTGFRKGPDSLRCQKIHKIIQQLPDKEWTEYVNWVAWALFYGLEA